MKNYYVECIVKYKNTDDDGKPYDDEEYYSFTIEANNRKEGRLQAKMRAIEEFTQDLNEYGEFKNVKCVIDEFYETTEDARS